jgi:hypothetical protein
MSKSTRKLKSIAKRCTRMGQIATADFVRDFAIAWPQRGSVAMTEHDCRCMAGRVLASASNRLRENDLLRLAHLLEGAVRRRDWTRCVDGRDQ